MTLMKVVKKPTKGELYEALKMAYRYLSPENHRETGDLGFLNDDNFIKDILNRYEEAAMDEGWTISSSSQYVHSIRFYPKIKKGEAKRIHMQKYPGDKINWIQKGKLQIRMEPVYGK